MTSKKRLVNASKSEKAVKEWFHKNAKHVHVVLRERDPLAYSERQRRAVLARWKKWRRYHPKTEESKKG